MDSEELEVICEWRNRQTIVSMKFYYLESQNHKVVPYLKEGEREYGMIKIPLPVLFYAASYFHTWHGPRARWSPHTSVAVRLC